MSHPRVFVAGGYLMNGGAHMAYHIGRVLHEQFQLPVSVIGNPPPPNTCFTYAYNFPAIPIPEAMNRATADDILISTGGLSEQMFGLTFPGRKLCYVQGVNTYAVLDAFFDKYVFCSQFVRQHVRHYFGVDGEVAHPFIDTNLFAGGKPWSERKHQIVVLGFKPITKALLPMITRELQQHFPEIGAPFMAFQYLSQRELSNVLGDSRYYLSLSAIEGFGLPMLEAMASGCAVIGFDAFGGKEFLVDGHNGWCSSYPDVKKLVANLAFAVANPDEAQRLAQNAYQTSRRFSKANFDGIWSGILENFLSTGSRGVHKNFE